MTKYNFTWFVRFADSKRETVQVHADGMNILGGALIFLAGKGYPIASFAPGTWHEIEIMSQMTGYPNGIFPLESD